MTTENQPDSELDRMKLDEIREKVQKILVDDFDATPSLAEEAAARIKEEDAEDFDNLDEFAEFIHDTARFWE